MNYLKLIKNQQITNKALFKEIDWRRKQLASNHIEGALVKSAQSPYPVSEKITMEGWKLVRSSTNYNQGLWLAKIVKFISKETKMPVNILELGTCAGIGSMYLLAAMSKSKGGHLVTFEGILELANLAQSNIDSFLSKNLLTNIKYNLVVGSFEETLNSYLSVNNNQLFNLVFIDGNHRKKNTLEYHELLRERLGKPAMIIHDDIGWSQEMKEAWHVIQELEGIDNTAALYLGNQPSRGIVFYNFHLLDNSSYAIKHTDSLIERFLRQAKSNLIK